MKVQRRIGIALCIAAFALSVPALAEEQATEDRYLELLRSDLRTEKIEILTEALDLTDQQGAAFWPIYREYDAELATLGDRRVALVNRFVETYGTISDEEAGQFAKDWFAIHKDRLKLREKYFGKVAKVTSNKVAARFVQVENMIGMILELQLAAELPLME